MEKEFDELTKISRVVSEYYINKSPSGKYGDFYWTLCASFRKFCARPSSLVQSWLLAKYINRNKEPVEIVFGWRLLRKSRRCLPVVWIRTRQGPRNPYADTQRMKNKKKKHYHFVVNIPKGFYAPPIHYQEELYFLGWKIYLSQLLKFDPIQAKLAIVLENLIKIDKL